MPHAYTKKNVKLGITMWRKWMSLRPRPHLKNFHHNAFEQVHVFWHWWRGLWQLTEGDVCKWLQDFSATPCLTSLPGWICCDQNDSLIATYCSALFNPFSAWILSVKLIRYCALAISHNRTKYVNTHLAKNLTMQSFAFNWCGNYNKLSSWWVSVTHTHLRSQQGSSQGKSTRGSQQAFVKPLPSG